MGILLSDLQAKMVAPVLELVLKVLISLKVPALRDLRVRFPFVLLSKSVTK